MVVRTSLLFALLWVTGDEVVENTIVEASIIFEESKPWDWSNFIGNSDIHYRNPRLCRVPAALPSAFSRALGKDGFAESRTRQSLALGNEHLYRE
jgi:hypothetical protein